MKPPELTEAAPRMRYQLSIPETAPSPNCYVRAHWTTYQRIKKHWALLVLEAMQASGKPAAPLQRSRVRIMRYGSRMLDPDNATASMKPLIDGLKANGMIADDSAKHIELHVEQGTRPKDALPCTLVEIEALTA